METKLQHTTNFHSEQVAPPDAKHVLADSAYYIRENIDNTYSVVKCGSYELEMLTSTKSICEEWIANHV